MNQLIHGFLESYFHKISNRKQVLQIHNSAMDLPAYICSYKHLSNCICFLISILLLSEFWPQNNNNKITTLWLSKHSNCVQSEIQLYVTCNSNFCHYKQIHGIQLCFFHRPRIPFLETFLKKETRFWHSSANRITENKKYLKCHTLFSYLSQIQ